MLHLEIEFVLEKARVSIVSGPPYSAKKALSFPDCITWRTNQIKCDKRNIPNL